MKNICYTFIMDYKGGTYISQTYAPNLTKACETWLESLNIDEIQGAGKKFKTELLIKVLDQEIPPVLLQGLQNVWCISAVVEQNELALINIIQTDTCSMPGV